MTPYPIYSYLLRFDSHWFYVCSDKFPLSCGSWRGSISRASNSMRFTHVTKVCPFHVARTPRPMSHVFCACSFRLFFLGLRVRAPPNAPMANGMVRAVCCSRGARRQTRISAVTGQINMQYVTRYGRFVWPVFHARPMHSVCCSFSFLFFAILTAAYGWVFRSRALGLSG